MGLADHRILEPVLKDLTANAILGTKNGTIGISEADPAVYKAFLKDLRFILVYLFIVLCFLCLALMFSAAASIHSTYEAYTAEVIGLKEILCSIKGRWKRALITTIWMILLSFASAVLLFFIVGVIGIMTEGSVVTVLSSVVLILGALYFVYVFALWMLSLVVSVLEKNLSGLKAIYQANELVKGKRRQGFAYMTLLILMSYAVHGIFALLSDLTNSKKEGLVGFVISISRIWSYCLMKLFVFAVYTLFYHECKMKHQVGENKHLYVPISAAAEV